MISNVNTAKTVVVGNDDNTKMETKNEVVITGSVVRKKKMTDNVIALTIAVRVPGDDIVNYPQITFYGEDSVEKIDSLIVISAEEKPRVTIYGMIQTRKKRYGDETRYFQSIIGKKLEFARTQMEIMTGIDGVGRHRATGVNSTCLIGPVVHKYDITRDNKRIGTILTLQTITEGKMNNPKVTCFKNASTVASRLEIGDMVCVTGYINTKEKRENGEYRKYESVIGTELAVI